MNALFKRIDKAGYKSRHKKKLQDCLEKTEKYMAMSNNEFLAAYIDANVKYEKKKTFLSGIPLALVLSILMGAGSCIYRGFMQAVSLMPYNENVLETIAILWIMVVSIPVILLVLLLKSLSNEIAELLKEKILLEEIKEMREKEGIRMIENKNIENRLSLKTALASRAMELVQYSPYRKGTAMYQDALRVLADLVKEIQKLIDQKIGWQEFISNRAKEGKDYFYLPYAEAKDMDCSILEEYAEFINELVEEKYDLALASLFYIGNYLELEYEEEI